MPFCPCFECERRWLKEGTNVKRPPGNCRTVDHLGRPPAATGNDNGDDDGGTHLCQRRARSKRFTTQSSPCSTTQSPRRAPSSPSPPSTLLDLPLIQGRRPSPPPPPSSLQQVPSSSAPFKPIRNDLSPAKRARVSKYRNYVPEEETIRNDYSQRYVDGGEWPQNWVIGSEMERRFEE